MRLLTLLSILCAVSSVAAQPPRAKFYEIKDLPGGPVRSEVRGISGDGRVVVGRSAVGTTTIDDGTDTKVVAITEGFRWTAAEGTKSLGVLRKDRDTWASAASYDGGVIVGTACEEHNLAFRWTEAEGMTTIISPLLRNGFWGGNAHDVSADGNVVVGSGAFRAPTVASYGAGFRWQASDPRAKLFEGTAADIKASYAVACAADGATVVLGGRSERGGEAYLWTETTGITEIGDLPGGEYHMRPFGISADGKTVVGFSISEFGTEPVRWTKEKGLVSLNAGRVGISPKFGRACDASADGSIIVGEADGAMIWNAEHGMVNLQELLTRHFGLNLVGWKLDEADAVSDDGLTIAGNGTFNGNTLGWVVVFEPPKGAKKKPIKK